MLNGIMFYPKTVGECLRRIRKELGLSLRELSRRSGVSYSHIRRVENGEFRATVDTFIYLVLCLGVPPGRVFEDCIMPSGAFYTETIEKDPGFLELASREKWTEVDRAHAAGFIAGCCSVVDFLLRVDWAEKCAKGLKYPHRGMKTSYTAFAREVDENYSASDRVSVLRELAEGGYTALSARGLCPRAYAIAQMKRLKKVGEAGADMWRPFFLRPPRSAALLDDPDADLLPE